MQKDETLEFVIKKKDLAQSSIPIDLLTNAYDLCFDYPIKKIIETSPEIISITERGKELNVTIKSLKDLIRSAKKFKRLNPKTKLNWA